MAAARRFWVFGSRGGAAIGELILWATSDVHSHAKRLRSLYAGV